jgi:beta-N-acetylhexosaminidase
MTENSDTKLSPDIRFHLIKRMERHKVIALDGHILLPHEAKYLEFHDVAGVVLFRRNVGSLTQVTDLVAGVAEQMGDENPPPLVMVDHEGDFVAELQNIIGVPPSAMAIAATGDVSLAGDVARETGLAMKKLGVNVVLAPVADCYLDVDSPITGLRTFGRDPERVAEMVAATIAGYREAGIRTCAKHFPGHGSTPEDSHETLPEVNKSLEELKQVDLVPFARAIEEGVDLMMISHVAFPMGEDTLTPASFDSRVMKTVLREQMGFDGVVITDALEMAGARWYARGRFGAGGFERSLLAGADILLHTSPVPEAVDVEGSDNKVLSINVMETVIRTLEKVVDMGEVDKKIARAAESNETLRNLLSMLDESHARIVRLRKSLPASSARELPRPADGHPKVIQFDAYPTVPGVYRTVAERSIAAWGEVSAGEALAEAHRCVVVPVAYTGVESLKQHDLDEFCGELCRQFSGWRSTDTVTGFVTGEDGEIYPDIREGPGVIDATRYTGQETTAFQLSGDEDLIVVFSARGMPPTEFVDSLGAFAARFEPAVVLVAGWPVLDWIPETTATLLCFGASSQIAAAVSRILAGEAEAVGDTTGLWPV